MKFTTVFAFFATVITVVSAKIDLSHVDLSNLDLNNLTNGQRLSMGLPPKAPQRRGGTPTYGMWIFYQNLVQLFINLP